MKKYTIRCFFVFFLCADRIDVITSFVVITNVVIKRAHCFQSPATRKRTNSKCSTDGSVEVETNSMSCSTLTASPKIVILSCINY